MGLLNFGKKKPDRLSKEEGSVLLTLARQTILAELGHEEEGLDIIKEKASRLLLKECRGTFVTLHKHGGLRGCIGNIEPVKTIFKSVIDNARHAAFHDSRFNPLSFDEVEDTEIEVSILTKPEKIDYKDSAELISKLKPGTDGVIISKKIYKSTFLPQVWENLKSPEEFLSQLCVKAGLPADEWTSNSLEISTYQVQVFEE